CCDRSQRPKRRQVGALQIRPPRTLLYDFSDSSEDQTAGAFFQRLPRPAVRANPRLRTKVTAITNGQTKGSDESTLQTRVPISSAIDSDFCPRRGKRR